jgi:hypothetical protein
MTPMIAGVRARIFRPQEQIYGRQLAEMST